MKDSDGLGREHIGERSQIQNILISLGYRWIFGNYCGVECLISGGSERWLGRGLDEEEAWDDAVRKALPSRLARVAVGAMAGADRSDGEEVREGAADRISGGAAASEGGARGFEHGLQSVAVGGEQAVEAEAGRDGAEAGRDGAEAGRDGATVEPAETNARPDEAAAEVPGGADRPSREAVAEEGAGDRVAREGSLQAGSAGGDVRRPVRAAPPTRATSEQLFAMEMLEEQFEQQRDEFAGLSRHLQRLGLLAVAARGRGIVEAADHATDVERKLTRLVGAMGEVARRYWPGTVKALNRGCSPEDAALHLALGSGLSRWEEVAEAAERRLEEELRRGAECRLDEAGWADRRACEPAPDDPEGELERVREKMRGLFGEFERDPGSECDRRLQHEATHVVPDLLRWARALRWLRPHVAAVGGVRGWAEAMGRLRWAATRLPREQRARLKGLLDEAQGPAKGSWLAELSEGKADKEKKKRRKELLGARPRGVKATEEAILGWLGEARALGEAFTLSEIAERVEDWAEAVRALVEDEERLVATVLDRGLRVTVRKLNELLGAPRTVAQLECETRIVNDEEPELGGEKIDSDFQDDVLSSEFAVLQAQVRDRVRGRHVLFVSNRADPHLKAQLERALELTIDWSEIDPRRLESRVASVRQGTFDLVLSATGFQSHSVDLTLGRECRDHGTPYVRVNRGRLTTTVSELARYFNISRVA